MDKRITEIVNRTSANDNVVLVGVRNSPNKIGVYDDIIYVFEDKVLVKEFEANTDPSIHRKGMASLISGNTYRYKTGIHGLSKPPSRRYRAFVQSSPVKVWREGQGVDIGFFGINIHRGGSSGTSSLGCQTIPPEQFDAFRSLVYRLLDENDQRDFPYILLDEATMELKTKEEGANAPSFTYVINGKSLGSLGIQVKTVAGYGYAIARVVAEKISTIPRKEVPFVWDEDKLLLNGKEIDYLDTDEGVTWASIGDIANAFGAEISIDSKNKQVTITKRS